MSANETGRGIPALPVALMCAIVVTSNILVQYPFAHFGLEQLLTWGAFTYPLAFFVTDLTNRRLGPQAARRVVYVGFALAVVLSIALASPRIALASGTAFLAGQLIDVWVFNALRRRAWWRAPLASSTIGSAVDTALFFSLAFAGAGMGEAVLAGGLTLPVWATWALGDFVVKMICALALLAPYWVLKRHIADMEHSA